MPGRSSTRFTDLRRVGQTGSTNSDLLDLARQGAPEGVVLVADHQTAGRGRLDRSWIAPPGSSLLVSVLLRPAGVPLAELHAVTVAVALAASDACRDVAGFEPALKWPNDLVVPNEDGTARKLGGVLAESVVSGGRLDAVVVGMGLNLDWPADLPAELVDIAVAANHVAGRHVDRDAVLDGFLAHLDRRYGDVLTAGGRAVQAREYRARCATVGRDVRVELAAGTFAGRAVDVTAHGHLVVEEAGGARREVTAGDVVHLR